MPKKSKKFLTKDNIAITVSVLAIAISAFFSIRQYQIQEIVYHLHIEPAISIYLDKSKLKLVIRNEGPVEVVSLSVSDLAILYSKSSKQLIAGFVGPDEFHTGKIYNTLKPGTMIKNGFSSISSKASREEIDDEIEILVFDLTYYRKSDLKKYVKQILFFVENDIIYSHKEFRSHKYYNDVLNKIYALIDNKYQYFFQSYPDAPKKAE